MNTTLRIPLNTNAEQHARLAQLQSAFAGVCNALSPTVQQTKVWNRVALHHLKYRNLREQFPEIGSQMVCNAIYSVSRTCRMVFQHPQSPFNLARLGDLTVELRRQLKPLGRQAEVARRAAQVQADLRDARLRLLADDLLALRATVEAEVRDETAVRERRALVEAELAAAQAREAALEQAQVKLAVPQFIVLVDRSPNVQAALLYWGPAEHGWSFVGAAPVSTGLPGRYEHFLTPLGVFDHSLANPDFRAEGTKNKLGFRGYGVKGMRIYDFGWIESPRGWGDGAMGTLRLQMHSTDPVLAVPRLGTAQSEGCVRIPATLNAFIDRYALLDEDYQRALASGDQLWILRKDRTPTPSPGRYMVVVDTQREVRPDWSPQPAKP